MPTTSVGVAGKAPELIGPVPLLAESGDLERGCRPICLPKRAEEGGRPEDDEGSPENPSSTSDDFDGDECEDEGNDHQGDRMRFERILARIYLAATLARLRGSKGVKGGL